MSVAAALCGAQFYPLHDRKSPPNATFNVYQTSDNQWFLIIVQDKDLPALAAAIGLPELLADTRFADDKKRAANSRELAEALDRVFLSQPWGYWRETFDRARITYGVVHNPADTIADPQLLENGIIVPLEGAGEKLKLTISSPLQIHDVPKVPARRAPDLGEHNDELLNELGFSHDEIERFRDSGAVPRAAQHLSGGAQ
jgi:formyl-CoA transferase